MVTSIVAGMGTAQAAVSAADSASDALAQNALVQQQNQTQNQTQTPTEDGPQTLADAPPNTIFQTLVRDGEEEAVGLNKRGNAGSNLYNPSQDRVTLEAGDVLVSRDGTEYEVQRSQNLPGSAGFVGPATTVYQGEQDTRFTGFADNTLIGVENGGAEGQTLDLNQTIPGDQDTGIYADSEGNRVVVQRPQITTLEIINQNGERIGDGSVEEDEFIIARADVNFLDAERAEWGPLTQDGSSVTAGFISREEALDRFPESADTIRELVPEGKAQSPEPDILDRSVENPNIEPRDTVYMIQDLSEVDDTGQFDLSISAEEDEPFGDFVQVTDDISRSVPIEVVSEDDPSIELADNESIVRGELVEYQITQSTAGENHVVSLSGDDLRTQPSGPTEVGQVTRVFREFEDGGFLNGVLLDDGSVLFENGVAINSDGDVVSQDANTTVEGEAIDEVFTLVEIDSNGLGINQIDTGFLDDTSVEVRLFEGFGNETLAARNYAAEGGENDIEERTLEVVEGGESLSIEQPDGTYVAGSEVDVEGTASPAFDSVSVYAREDGDWQLIGPSLRSINVRSDGTWSEEDVDLSDESPLLSVPDTVRIGVIQSEDADIDNDGEPDDTLTTSDFSSGTSDQRSLRVTNQSLDGTFQTFGGEVAVEDGVINVSGTAVGPDEVIVGFVDSNGNTVVTTETVDDDFDFENEDISLSDADGQLSEGEITGFIISAGRDATIGAAGEGPDTVGEFVDFIDELEGRSLTRQQAIELVQERSVNDDGSDDIAVGAQFRLTDASTTIESVDMADGAAAADAPIAAGSEVTISGETNLQPDDNTIVLEVTSGPSAEEISIPSVDEWGMNGTWSTTFTVPDTVEPGTYEIEADDGESVTTTTIEVVSELGADVSIQDQSVDDQQVTVDSVNLSQGGYVAIREGDAEGRLIGISEFLEPGTAENVTVPLEEELNETTDVVAVAHMGTADTIGDPYEVDGEPVAVDAQLDVPDEETETPTPETETAVTEETETTTELEPAPEETETPGTTPGAGPGFSVVLAILAVLGVALLAIRRLR
jgi:major cell surface glycoprotein (TIGR04216 family)